MSGAGADAGANAGANAAGGAAAAGDAANLEAEIFGDAEQKEIENDMKNASVDEIKQRIRLLDNDIRVMKSETQRLKHEVRNINNIFPKKKDMVHHLVC
jgi:26S proteasome regulatory subunit T5